MINLSASYDDRSFASGVVTTQTTDSCYTELNLPKRHSTASTSCRDPTMDKTQSVEETSKYLDMRTSRSRCQLKISYAKPRVCTIHFKTLTHIIAACLTPLILVDAVFILNSTAFCSDAFRKLSHLRYVAGSFSLMALLLSSSHVAVWYYRRESTQKTANMTLWITILTTGCLSISACVLWAGSLQYLPRQQVIVPFQYISFFGSIISMSAALLAVFHEWQASKYAITY